MNPDQAVKALAALAQESRLMIFRILIRQGSSGMIAGDIAKAAGISATNVSFHLKELDRAGLLTATRQGRFIRYAVHVDGVRRLLQFLTEDCCGGRPELCGAAFSTANICKEQKE